uniref:A18-like helicase n=1 Tax=Mimivirus LCMiAC02 TaxID=2506609 RepID=A0A481Z1A6_9VIRU|nr:MAG: A18-like helicase [Mimivirus LCMiAC02]
MNKHKTLSKQGYAISKNQISVELLKKLKRELTVKPRVNLNYGVEVESYKIFKEDNDYIYLPKYFGITKFGKPSKTIFNEHKIKMKFNGTLRSKQLPIAKQCLKTIKKTGGGLISLHTGAGKTVIALYLACMLGLKTLVIVHKTFLQNQWYDRIKQFTNARIGIIRQNKIDIKDKDIVIGMLHSISMKDYPEEVFNEFNVLLVDEIHHISSRIFSKSLFKTVCKYTIGLSATPHRADGLTKVINWHIGDIIYDLKRPGSKNVIVKMFDYDTYDPLFVLKKQWRPGNKWVASTVKTISNILKIKDRNKFIVSIIKALCKYTDRKLLVITDRHDHIDILKKSFDKYIKMEEKNNKLDKNEITTSRYTGKQRQCELEFAIDADVIFATYGMASEGLDINGLNTIIFATPKKNIIQSIGRIMRKPLEDCEVKPMIIDINDKISIFQYWGKLRKKYYKKNKYTIDTYVGFNDKCISVKNFLIKRKRFTNDENIKKDYMCYMYGESDYNMAITFKLKDSLDYSYKPNMNKIFNIDTIKDKDIIEKNEIILNNIIMKIEKQKKREIYMIKKYNNIIMKIKNKERLL